MNSEVKTIKQSSDEDRDFIEAMLAAHPTWSDPVEDKAWDQLMADDIDRLGVAEFMRRLNAGPAVPPAETVEPTQEPAEPVAP